MLTQNQNGIPADRRKHTRWSVCNFLHASVTLSESETPKQAVQKQLERFCNGILADISHKGAQAVMPLDCEKYLRENKYITMHIKTLLKNINIDVKAGITSLTPAENYDGIRVGVLFAELDSNPEAEDAIDKMCEYIGTLVSAKAT